MGSRCSNRSRLDSGQLPVSSRQLRRLSATLPDADSTMRARHERPAEGSCRPQLVFENSLANRQHWLCVLGCFVVTISTCGGASEKHCSVPARGIATLSVLGATALTVDTKFGCPADFGALLARIHEWLFDNYNRKAHECTFR